MKRLLIIDDELSVLYAFEKAFSKDYLVITAESGKKGIEGFQKNKPHVVLLDLKLPDISGLEVLKKLKELNPEVPVIVITAFADSETATTAMKEGAFDYVSKPFDIQKIREIIKRAKESHSEEVIEFSNFQEVSFVRRLIGKSQAILEISKLVGQLADHDVPVLIEGESGVGKELVARAIHENSKRRNKPFVVVNCAALPEGLVESELFGYEPGAFTSAEKRKLGKFEVAQGGTIFLDEIGDMSPLTQAKILRVLQEKTFERLGGNTPIIVDVRIIAATNKDLSEETKRGNFRKDLYHRLNVVNIKIPPLRERREDIPLLVEFFVKKYAREADLKIRGITKDALEVLLNYSWPGNVRELENVLRRAVILSKGSYITKDELFLDKEKRELSFVKTIEDLVNSVLLSGQNSPYHALLSQIEQIMIQRALEITGGNQLKASFLLGINRLTLRKKIKEYNIKK